MSKLHLFLVTYLGLHSLALPVMAHSGIGLHWGSLPEIMLSDASKLASTYFSFYRLIVVQRCRWCQVKSFLLAMQQHIWIQIQYEAPWKRCHESKEKYQCRCCGAVLMLQRDMKRHLRNLHKKKQWSTPWMANFKKVNSQTPATSPAEYEMSFDTEHDTQLDFLLSHFVTELPPLDDV